MRIPQKQPTEAASPSRQQRRTEQTRARLMEAALEVLLERGYDGTSLAHITERADLGTGTFYLHFTDKRSVYEAIVRQRLLALRRRWLDERTARGMDGHPPEEVALLVRLVIEALVEERKYARLVLVDGPPVETWLVDDIGRGMADIFGDRVKDGEFVSNLVIGATIAASRWALTRPRSIPTDRLVEDAVAFCSAGVATATPVPRKRRS